MIFSIVLAIFVAMILEGCLEHFSIDFGSDDIPTAVIFTIASTTAFFLYRDELTDGLQKNRKSVFVKQLFIGTLLSILSNVVGNRFRETFLGGSAITANEASVETMLSQLPILAFLTAVIFGPIVEETVCRRILQKWVKTKAKWHSSGIAVLISSAVFGFLHSGFSTESIPYFLDGLVLGILYEKTDNYALIVCTHMSHNLIAVIIKMIMINCP